MKKLKFTKLTGAGNDFILFDSKINPQIDLSEDQIVKLCDRHFGIGADGILIISESDEVDFNMYYYNSDGSLGSLCGNGARSILKYSFANRWINSNNAVFVNNGTKYSGKINEDGNVTFYLNSPKNLKYNFKVKAANQMINSHFADTGSPHLIINIEDVLVDSKNANNFYSDINSFPVYELGKELRYSKDILDEGVNVNFIKIDGDKILIRTYERGVENETLACGTGSTAAALISSVIFKLNPPIKIITKSNSELIVNFEVENQKVKNLSLTGPAEVVFSGEILI